ncbi:MAG: HPr family phosphocarrier protein [Gammaproteobacteria bacterium]|nr:HPr family phosphocarrier protein [Gammaproteobacteria bacterium]MBQ0839694.1 HPr family phosphocarrier protein [Gammaproteobacteria bacterium]
MINDQLEIINKLGLHARAAAKLATTCNRFACTIKTGHDGKLIDAKSVMSLMLLAAGQGTVLHFEFDGADEMKAHVQVKDLLTDYFGEGQ